MTLRTSEPRRSRIEEEILRAIRAVRYGSVEIVIHDARVVQIERREKVRPAEGMFARDDDGPAGERERE